MNHVVSRVSEHFNVLNTKPSNLAKLWKKNPLSSDEVKELINLATLELINQSHHEVKTPTPKKWIYIFYKYTDDDGYDHMDMKIYNSLRDDHNPNRPPFQLDGSETVIYQENDDNDIIVEEHQFHRAICAKFGCNVGGWR